MVEWIAEKCLNGVENGNIFERCWQYQYLLERRETTKVVQRIVNVRNNSLPSLGGLLELFKVNSGVIFYILSDLSTDRDC